MVTLMYYIGLACIYKWYLILFVSSVDSCKTLAALIVSISAITVGVLFFPTALVLIIVGSLQSSDSFIATGTTFLIPGVAAVITFIIVLVIWWKYIRQS